VAEQQEFAVKEGSKAHQLLENRATQGSCLLIP